MTGSIADRFFNYDGPPVREGTGVVRFLADRPDSDWTKLVQRTETRRYNIGHTIIAAGERDQALYLLTEGVVGVIRGLIAARLTQHFRSTLESGRGYTLPGVFATIVIEEPAGLRRP
jgi:hypothetical protein